MTVTGISTWSDLNELLDRFPVGWIFRGQPQCYGNLLSSFARETRKTTCLTAAIDIEGRAIRSFARTAHHYVRTQEVTPLRTVEMDALSFSERLRWLALMQHYGAPTRLLDWTESLFVAAYFAVEKVWYEDGEVWACEIDSLREAAAKTLVFKSPEKTPVLGFDNTAELQADIDASPLVRMLQEHPDRHPPDLNWEEWRKSIPLSLESVLTVVRGMRQIDVDLLVLDNDVLQSVVFPMTVHVVTDRIHAQQGWFTVSLDPRIDHYDGHTLNGVKMERFKIPASLKTEFLRKLRAANVAGHALFPGLDGLGRSVSEQIRLELS